MRPQRRYGMHPLPQAVERLSAGHIELNFSAEFDCNCLCPATVHMCTHTHCYKETWPSHSTVIFWSASACVLHLHSWWSFRLHQSQYGGELIKYQSIALSVVTPACTARAARQVLATKSSSISCYCRWVQPPPTIATFPSKHQFWDVSFA